jgi:hypothetical protein
MSVPQQLIDFALVGIPVGLVLGMGLGLVAGGEHGWGGYGSFRRRAARLAHVAAVMLPLLAGFYGLALEARASSAAPGEWVVLGARLWMPGSCALVAVLLLAAWRPAWRFVLPLPALTLVVAACAMASPLVAS